MLEKVLDELDIEGDSSSLLFSLPSLKGKTDPILIFLIIVTSFLIVFLTLKLQILSLWLEFLKTNAILKIVFYPLLFSTVFIFSGIIFRTVLWFRYKPMSLDYDKSIEWPSVTVIMPALNEEESVELSIHSIFKSIYPQDKFQVICIDDGSTDSTLEKMKKAKQIYKDKLRIIAFKNNLGKRKALYVGLKNATGQIIITVDSDSRIGRNAIRNIVVPLIKDKNTGAVAGRVEVLNEKQNFLTRMLAIRYSISFNFGRAYQSVYGAVFCCPGALTAYRKDILEKFIHEWVNQKFLNTPCTYGEDRALTTNILKLGYMTRFQSNALVYTKAPAKFNQMNRMYLRWTRSYLRESVLFAQFMFKNYRPKNRILPILDFLFLNLLHPFHLLLICLLTYSFFIHPVFILRHLAFIVVMSFLLSLYYLRANRSFVFLYGIPYALITAFCLWWIVPYAALTLKNQSWMTR
jgi:hyaluronan synthase